ncbi:WecB/TagA/CpsF family glycosyltransferase [Nocardioides sp. SOB77]|uniref:WecB/TagA/CpsF family glycosyltransferase n=1 Tax=Nocardioides oceani TaxID=3058369 RepID=A0ABT8FIR2_9ACTN|nr:WecB/TagA/CpsF family glycosyltransferase [Nocardioides oceani]MDN4174574.1 WecB/TagA/CpsF family glycosyltransferase [Nocardioides oceani]
MSAVARAAADPPRRPVGRRRRTVVMRVDDGVVSLGGHRLFTGTEEQLLASIAELRALGRPTLMVTANVDQALDLERRAGTAEAYAAADLVIVDGMPLVHLARALGARGIHRHTGADLLPQVAGLSGGRRWRVVVLGGDPAVAEQAVRNLRADHPGARISAVPFPWIDSADDPASSAAVEGLHRARPDMVFVCLGSPKQEAWYLTWQDALPPAVYIGAGAAVDFAAGRFARAPKVVQRIGGEWVWRLCQEPRRLAHRYLVKGPRIVRVALRSWAARRSPDPEGRAEVGLTVVSPAPPPCRGCDGPVPCDLHRVPVENGDQPIA